MTATSMLCMDSCQRVTGHLHQTVGTLEDIKHQHGSKQVRSGCQQIKARRKRCKVKATTPEVPPPERGKQPGPWRQHTVSPQHGLGSGGKGERWSQQISWGMLATCQNTDMDIHRYSSTPTHSILQLLGQAYVVVIQHMITVFLGSWSSGSLSSTT